MAQSARSPGKIYGNVTVNHGANALLGDYHNEVHIQNATFLLSPTTISQDTRTSYKYERTNEVFDTYTTETITEYDLERGASYKKVLRWDRKEDLGAGVFGVVHLEEASEHGKVEFRAVKILRRQQLATFKVDFKREIGALQRLSHPNYVHRFVQFYVWYEAVDNIHLAMEYIPGQDLTGYIKSGLVESDVRQIAYQVLDGITIMHRLDIVHRDLKPGNVFVVQREPTWWVKIGDFSICKSATTQHTFLHTVVGTFGYQAPEILGFVPREKAEQYNAKCDVWSFGCLLYHMFASRVPFAEFIDLMVYCQDASRFPSDHIHSISANGISFLKNVLQPDPRNRPTSDQAMALGSSWFSGPLAEVIQSLQPKEIALQPQGKGLLYDWIRYLPWPGRRTPEERAAPQETSLQRTETSPKPSFQRSPSREEYDAEEPDDDSTSRSSAEVPRDDEAYAEVDTSLVNTANRLSRFRSSDHTEARDPTSIREPVATKIPQLACKHKAKLGCKLATVPVCCACADQRPRTSGYLRYTDGRGTHLSAIRWKDYCPPCKANPVDRGGVQVLR